MISKKITCTIIAIASYLLFSSFTIDCNGQLNLDVNSSLDEFGRDKAYCIANYEWTEPMCLAEANASFNSQIDNNLNSFSNCCCISNIPACCG
ncbi:MAG: hypothetical protein DRI69_05130 [Bacteroidetes bacterium]|nr:MAG: hypothetical protein DRI69_05130 [Bacteroidota bacterium]